jgi:non-canonical purine NTP pyrophosphatase (RdgB/HAM1 family)
MQQLTFITSNQGKLKQVQHFLHHPIIHQPLDLTEIQSLDLREIVTHKVKDAYSKINAPVLVEDVSLIFVALNKLPGPLIKWFLSSLGTQGLCDILPPDADRSAIAEVQYAYYDGENLEIFTGQTKGKIALTHKGEDFGWNPIFIPEGYDRTWAEIPLEEQKNFSMRAIALQQLDEFLEKQNDY